MYYVHLNIIVSLFYFIILGIAGIRTNINQVPIEIKDETEDNVNENHDNAETEIIITDNVQNSNGSEHILNQNVSSVQSEDIDDVVSRIR